jgi:hypothetical protein
MASRIILLFFFVLSAASADWVALAALRRRRRKKSIASIFFSQGVALGFIILRPRRGREEKLIPWPAAI